MEKSEKVLFSVREVSEFTGLDKDNVRAAIERGEIPGKRFGRNYKVPAWWIEEQRNGPRSGKAA